MTKNKKTLFYVEEKDTSVTSILISKQIFYILLTIETILDSLVSDSFRTLGRAIKIHMAQFATLLSIIYGYDTNNVCINSKHIKITFTINTETIYIGRIMTFFCRTIWWLRIRWNFCWWCGGIMTRGCGRCWWKQHEHIARQ